MKNLGRFAAAFVQQQIRCGAETAGKVAEILQDVRFGSLEDGCFKAKIGNPIPNPYPSVMKDDCFDWI